MENIQGKTGDSLGWIPSLAASAQNLFQEPASPSLDKASGMILSFVEIHSGCQMQLWESWREAKVLAMCSRRSTRDLPLLRR